MNTKDFITSYLAKRKEFHKYNIYKVKVNQSWIYYVMLNNSLISLIKIFKLSIIIKRFTYLKDVRLTKIGREIRWMQALR